MSQSLIDDVIEFHEAMNVTVGEGRPALPNTDQIGLRLDLIMEEFQETLVAIGQDDLVETADGLIDLLYVTIGALVAFGMPIQPLWDEVHRTNMAKLAGERREDGKILKPEGWQPPDLRSILIAHGADLRSP